ncbi:uncharacterized protein LOC111519203 [Drosophila willistoni]|uniref:uncharacterized protein LOC111519203 n=1 Tax=Drosophila willistoni TaxID=7260 RepID=UPI000C26C3A4|nr:uncharacterized protein LOC111519203 [Drosophila willistoni]
MLKRMCCMRLKTAGYVFGGIDIVVNTLLLALLLFFVIDYVAYGEVFMLIVLAIVFVKLQSGFMMILGIKMQRHLLLLPWLIIFGIQLIYIIFQSSTVMGYEIDFNINVNQSTKCSVMILLLLVIPSWLFGLYILYGIYSLYKEIQATRKHQQAQL